MAEINISKMAQNVAEKAIQELRDNGVFVGRWIPIDERLPQEFQRVLITIVNYNGDKVVRVAELHIHSWNKVFLVKENYEQWEVGEKGLLAWMPLPEPYTGESEDKK